MQLNQSKGRATCRVWVRCWAAGQVVMECMSLPHRAFALLFAAILLGLGGRDADAQVYQGRKRQKGRRHEITPATSCYGFSS